MQQHRGVPLRTHLSGLDRRQGWPTRSPCRCTWKYLVNIAIHHIKCHFLPLAVVLFAKYGLYGRVEDKLVLSRTFGTARLENPESKLDTTQIITRLIWWLAIAWWWWWRRVRSMNMRWCLITTSDNNCENSHDNPADNLQAVNQSSLKWKWKWK